MKIASLLLACSATFGQSSLPLPMRVVTGAPYSGEQAQERVETLGDGSRVTRRIATARMYRDSQGRTRTEREDAIEINDPVAGVRYTLDPRSKVARLVMVPRSQIIPGDEPAAVVIIPSGTDIRFTPPEPGAPVTGILTATPAGQAGGAPPQIKTEDLGTLKIDGLLVEGSRQTITIPGDGGPSVTVSDTWTSPELKIAMLSKVMDPRTGETSVRMTHLSRSEPPAELFRPPADYWVVEGPSSP